MAGTAAGYNCYRTVEMEADSYAGLVENLA